MSLVVNTNVSYPTAQRSRAESTSVLDNTTGRLSLGSKISGQSDDVIGLAIVQRITSQINGLLMAVQVSGAEFHDGANPLPDSLRALPAARSAWVE